MMWGVLGCAAGFAITIVRERKQGTFLRLQVAPVTRSQIVAGKALACFLTVIGVIAVMVALGTWLGMRPRSPALLAIAAVCIAFCFVGIMILMSMIGKSEEAVSGGAWAANMFMAMFGGGMMPLLFMPGFMKTLSNFSPVKWSILALEGSIWRGFTLCGHAPAVRHPAGDWAQFVWLLERECLLAPRIEAARRRFYDTLSLSRVKESGCDALGTRFAALWTQGCLSVGGSSAKHTFDLRELFSWIRNEPIWTLIVTLILRTCEIET